MPCRSTSKERQKTLMFKGDALFFLCADGMSVCHHLYMYDVSLSCMRREMSNPPGDRVSFFVRRLPGESKGVRNRLASAVGHSGNMIVKTRDVAKQLATPVGEL